jgi:sugar O-acyltransferase (sialic acid O-acetyltransferase NeuD family)
MNKIFIIGAGGFAKEVFFLLKGFGIYEICGFIDVKPQYNSIKIGDETVLIIDEDDFFTNYKDVSVCIGTGYPKIIKQIIEKYKNYTFPNIIHPSFIGNKDSILMGYGNIITAGVIFTTDIKIGNFNIFNLGCTVGHDCKISDGNVFNPGTNISGNCTINNNNLFGVGSSILEKLTVGNNNVIGGGAVIINNINNNSTYVGVPGKKIK